MIVDDLIDNRVATRRAIGLEKNENEENQRKCRSRCEHKPGREVSLRGFRFASQRGANVPAQSRGRAVGRRIVVERVPQRANLFLDAAALVAGTQVLLDLAHVD